MTPFDLRPLLSQGIDPLAHVIERVQKIAQGGSLVLDAPFNPVPLRRVLAQMGFSSRAEKLGDAHWRVQCRRDGRGEVAGDPTEEDCRGLPDLGAPVRREPDGIHIDVRGLPAPSPMVAILRLCAVVEPGVDIVVHHEREPVYLYPELAEIGWTCATEPGEPGEVRLRLTKEGGE